MWYKWTREEFRTGQTIWCVVVFCFFFLFFSLYMYLSYIFYFKESTIITTEKQKSKQIKKKYRNVEGKSLPIVFDYVLPIWQSSPFFFQLVLKLHPYLLVPLQLKGGNLLILHICFLILSLLLAKNKSLSSSSLKWVYNFKQICFPPKLAANEQPQKMFLWIFLIRSFIWGYVYYL